MYREQAVENAFEIWLMARRPYSANMRELPFLDALFDIELMAIEMMIEWYYARTPASLRSHTPPPAVMENEDSRHDVEIIQRVIEQLLEERRLVVDQLGLVWASPRPGGLSRQGIGHQRRMRKHTVNQGYHHG